MMGRSRLRAAAKFRHFRSYAAKSYLMFSCEEERNETDNEERNAGDIWSKYVKNLDIMGISGMLPILRYMITFRLF